MSSSTIHTPEPSANGTNGTAVTLTALNGEDAPAQERADAQDWRARALLAEDALRLVVAAVPRITAAPRSPLGMHDSEDFLEGVRLAYRDRKQATYRHQVAYAVRRTFHRRHGRPNHPVARLTAVVRRHRFADGAVSPCCSAWGTLVGVPWCPGIVFCPDCGTPYRKA